MSRTKSDQRAQTYAEYRHSDLHPNPLNPRRIFDKYKLDVLEESIRANKILVPLTVYRERRDGKLYILDGERRWRCAVRIETGEVSALLESRPAGLRIPQTLSSVLLYDPRTRVLTHKAPIDSNRRGMLLAMSASKSWQSAIEGLYRLSKERPPKEVAIPVNIVDPPGPAANMLYMFHTHNLREQWELMPTALSLEVLIKELRVDDDSKLAELTKLSASNVKRCKTLLSFPKKYQSMMLDPDTEKRLKANLFIEMAPVLDFYEDLGSAVSGGRNRDQLTDLFIEKYRGGLIPSVVHFRHVLEAKDLFEGTERWEEVERAAERFVKDPKSKIRSLFDPLIAEDKGVLSAAELCKEFLSRLRKLKISHATRTRTLRSALRLIVQEVQSLLESLEEE